LELINEERITKAELYVFEVIKGMFSEVTKFLFSAIIITPLVFYMYFRRRKAIQKEIFTHIPKKMHTGFVRAAKHICSQLHDYLTAKVLESAVIAVICCTGFWLAGLKGWLILGVIAGFLNIIPYVGPIIGVIPALLIGLLDHPMIALYVIITIIIAQLVDNLYLIPFMISSKVKIGALLTIVLILIGSKLLGPLGMIFAIPIYLVYKIVLRESYKELVKMYKG